MLGILLSWSTSLIGGYAFKPFNEEDKIKLDPDIIPTWLIWYFELINSLILKARMFSVVDSTDPVTNNIFLLWLLNRI